jgi:hypothetical protein
MCPGQVADHDVGVLDEAVIVGGLAHHTGCPGEDDAMTVRQEGRLGLVRTLRLDVARGSFAEGSACRPRG